MLGRGDFFLERHTARDAIFKVQCTGGSEVSRELGRERESHLVARDSVVKIVVGMQQAAMDAALDQLEREKKLIEECKHPEYLRRCRRLQHAKQERLKRARQTLDAELQTLHRLHELDLVRGSVLK